MGIKWNGTLVIPSPIAPWVEVWKGLTVEELFTILSLAQIYYAFCQFRTGILTASNIIMHITPYDREIIKVLCIQGESHGSSLIF